MCKQISTRADIYCIIVKHVFQNFPAETKREMT